MKVFSVATDRVAFLSSLEDSARRFGYDLHVLGRDQKWQGFLWRWTLVLDAVEALDPDEVVSVVDGYDVVLAGPAELLEKLYHSAVPAGDALVFGHSHIPWDSTTASGLRLLNPGSPTDRRRQPTHTWMTAEVHDGALDAVTLHHL